MPFRAVVGATPRAAASLAPRDGRTPVRPSPGLLRSAHCRIAPLALPRPVLIGSTLSLHALERLPEAMYVADRAGVLRWLNRAGRALVGDATGRAFPQVIAPERLHETREQFARKVIGAV